MKIIDEKGRIFGKINVIDFLVILFLVFLAPVFFFAYKIVFMAEPLEGEFIEIERNCLLIKLKPELLELISDGDKELNRNGQVIGEIVSLDQSVPYKYEFNIGKNQKIIKEDPILKQIKAKLKLTVDVKQGTLFYKDWEIRIGSPLMFTTKKYSLMTVPLEEEEKSEERIIDLNVTLKDLDEDTIKKISVGDKELNDNGNTIAEILSLDRVEDSSRKFDLGSNSVVKEEEGAKKQISARMRLKCQMEDGSQLYFKGEKVEYNSYIEFKTDKYEIAGLVTFKEKWLNLRVKFSLVIPEVARFILKGDVEKDIFERTIGRIDSILSNELALLERISDSGKFISLNHPFKRDIVVSLDAQCMEKEGAYYYKDSLAKMGNVIVFNTTSYSISGMIVGLRIE